MEQTLRPAQLREVRLAAGLTQEQAAKKLGVSQAYLALLEGGHRPLTAGLERKIAKLFRIGPVALRVSSENLQTWNSSSLAAAIAALGYPGFPRRTGAAANNPASVLLAAVASRDLEVRVVEALPWVAVAYSSLDWEWLVREAKIRDVQNRLGFVVALARQVAEKREQQDAAAKLRDIEAILDRARLVREDTLCQESLSEAERRWLRHKRSAEAARWNLLTDLDAELLPYAA